MVKHDPSDAASVIEKGQIHFKIHSRMYDMESVAEV